MALEFQIQQYPFQLGLSEGTDPRQVQPGTLTTAENAVWRQSGRLEKRYGTSLLPVATTAGGTITSARRIFSRGTELCLNDGTNLYGYSEAVTAWRAVDAVPEVGLTHEVLIDTSIGIEQADIARSSTGLLVTSWITADGLGALYVKVTDRAGATVLPTTNLATSAMSRVRVVIIGTTAIVITQSGANIIAIPINLTTFAVSVSSTLRTDSANGGLDAVVIGSAFVIVFASTTGPSTRLCSFDASLTPIADVVVQAASGSSYMSLDGLDGDLLYVAYTAGGLLRVAVHDPTTLAQTAGPTTIENMAAPGIGGVGICRKDATGYVIVYSDAQTPPRTTSYFGDTTSAPTTNTARTTQGAQVVTSPFVLNGRVYSVMLDFPSLYTTTTFQGANTSLMEVETSDNLSSTLPHRYVGQVDGLIGGVMASQATLAHVVTESLTSLLLAVPFLSAIPSKTTNWRQGLRLVNATVGASVPADLWRAVTYGQESYLVGPCLAAYDGELVFDYGFPRAPVFQSSITTSPAGAIVAGDYNYGLIQEFRSNVGVLHRSPTSTRFASYSGTSSTAFVFSGVSFTAKQKQATGYNSKPSARILLALYRSTAGTANPQRLSFEPLYNVVIANVPAATQLLTDARADASIDGLGTKLSVRPFLYTVGGVNDDFTTPCCVTSFLHVDRLFVLNGDQRTWCFSKSFQDDLGVAPGFHVDFRISFDKKQVAGASLDDKAIFLSETGVSYMSGVGPAPDGSGSDFQPPTPIQTDVGCTSARSVVSTPDGIMFLSARGLYLLTRGLELVWIGRPVKSTLASYPNVTSAVLVAKHNQVRFTCNNNAGTAGIVLVYDYAEKQWATAKYHDGTTYGCAIADACIHGGTWHFVTPLGLVFRESTSSYLDNATYVPMTLETAWISAAGPLAFHSVRSFTLHGESFTGHDLLVEAAFDSDTSYPQQAPFAAGTPVTTVGVEECTVTIGTRRKCQTIRFRISDATPSSGPVGTGRGPAFDMMGLEVGIKRGFQTTPATKKG